MIRRFKLVYILYNLFQKKKLQHNVPLYKKIGLRKRYFSPVSNSDFASIASDLLKPEHEIPSIENASLFKQLNTELQENIKSFDANGYAIIKSYLDNDTVDAINNEIEDLLQQKKVDFKYRNKIMFAIHQSELLKRIGNDKNLLELLNAMTRDEMKLFQSINFLSGSEQKTHSDSIHMTTYPLGGLLGVWIALEDIEMDNGPLHYYPGSHTLPYYLNSDYDNSGNFFLIGEKGYTAYEEMLETKVKEMNLEKKVFKAKKGDLLIWHANLLHGGEPHVNKTKTRKSMVFHYFAVNRICYHEITQRPALMS